MELCLCDITFQAMILLILISHFRHELYQQMFTTIFNNECSSMCVSIGFNESFDDGKDKSYVFVKEY